MKKNILIWFLLCCFFIEATGQEHSTSIEAQLDEKENILRNNQRIIYSNTSDSILTEIYLHNWANGYKNNKAPLSKRLIEDMTNLYTLLKKKIEDIQTLVTLL